MFRSKPENCLFRTTNITPIYTVACIARHSSFPSNTVLFKVFVNYIIENRLFRFVSENSLVDFGNNWSLKLETRNRKHHGRIILHISLMHILWSVSEAPQTVRMRIFWYVRPHRYSASDPDNIAQQIQGALAGPASAPRRWRR